MSWSALGMAGAVNPFSLLANAEASAPIKTKKKSKKKAGITTDNAISKVGVAHEPVQAIAEADDSFQVVRRGSHSKSKQANGAAPALNGLANGIKQGQEDPLLKVASSASGKARNQLVIDWITQVRTALVALLCCFTTLYLPHLISAAALRLTALSMLVQLTDSDHADLRDRVLESGALERLLLAFATDAVAEDVSPLSTLLSTLANPSLPPNFADSMAELVVAAGRLVPRDSLAPSSQIAAAVTAGVVLLRRGIPAPKRGPTSADAAVEALLACKARALECQDALDKAASTRDEVRLAAQLFLATSDAADLVDPEAKRPASSETAAALGALEALQAALASRAKVLSAIQACGSVEEQVAASERAHAREDAALAAQEADAAAVVADLEKQLAAAKAVAAAARDRRAAAAAQHAKALAQLRSGAAASAANAAELSAAMEVATAQAARMDAALRATSASTAAPQGGAKAVLDRASAEGIPALLADSAQRVLQARLRLLKELAGKAAFYRERLDAAARQAEHLAVLDDPQKVQEHAKQRASMQKMLQDVVQSSTAAEREAQAAVDAWRERSRQLRRVLGHAAVPEAASREIEALGAAAAEVAEDIVAGRAPEVPAPAPARSKLGGKGAPTHARALSSPSEQSGRTTPVSASLSAATATTAEDVARGPTQTTGELAALEQRLAALEAENRKKDEQIAAMLAAASVDIPSPAPMNGKPWGGAKVQAGGDGRSR